VDVTINDAVTTWCGKHNATNTLNSKCTEAHNNDLSCWRQITTTLYDVRASGDYRIVAVVSGSNFAVKAIYRHPTRGGKEYVAGERVKAYGSG